jgi:hypothetical protein
MGIKPAKLADSAFVQLFINLVLYAFYTGVLAVSLGRGRGLGRRPVSGRPQPRLSVGSGGHPAFQPLPGGRCLYLFYLGRHFHGIHNPLAQHRHQAHVSCHTFEGERLILGRISLGEDSLVGARAYIFPNVTIGRRCSIGVNTIVRKNRVLRDGSMIGSPAGLPIRSVARIERESGTSHKS